MMEAILIIFNVLLLADIITSIVFNHYRKIHNKLMEEQNETLWAIHKYETEIMSRLTKSKGE